MPPETTFSTIEATAAGGAEHPRTDGRRTGKCSHGGELRELDPHPAGMEIHFADYQFGHGRPVITVPWPALDGVLAPVWRTSAGRVKCAHRQHDCAHGQ